MTRYRIELTDTRGGELLPERLARLLKTALRRDGFRAGPCVPVLDTPPTPAELAGRMVAVVSVCAPGSDCWEIWWLSETGSRLYCLDEVYSADLLSGRRQFWTLAVAQLLELGARRHRDGQLELPS
jgi:hypothetical protein